MHLGKLALHQHSVPSGSVEKHSLLADRPAGGAPRPAGAFTKPLDNIPAGILYMVLATFLFAVSSAIAKWQVAIYPVGEVMFFRSAASLLVCAAVVLPFTGLSVFATSRPGAHFARGLSQSISQTFTVIAFSLMPLAGAIAINFSAPLWAALLSVLWLKERASPMRWAVLLTGFSGVLIVASPGTDSLQIGALFALANAIMYGSVTVAVRGMTATESAVTLLMWQMVVIAILHTFLLAFGFRMPTAMDAAMLVLQRRRQCRRAICLDALAVAGADDRGVAVLLPDAGLGDRDRILRVGRRSHAGLADRLRDRRRLRTSAALARSQAEAPRLKRQAAIDLSGPKSAITAGTCSAGTAAPNR